MGAVICDGVSLVGDLLDLAVAKISCSFWTVACGVTSGRVATSADATVPLTHLSVLGWAPDAWGWPGHCRRKPRDGGIACLSDV